MKADEEKEVGEWSSGEGREDGAWKGPAPEGKKEVVEWSSGRVKSCGVEERSRGKAGKSGMVRRGMRGTKRVD
jgi:hypothetical protein